MKLFQALLIAGSLLGIAPALADTRFDYAGNNFDFCYGANTGMNTSCFGGHVSGYFITSLSGDALDNLSNVFIADTALSIENVVTFSFSDGINLEMTPADSDFTGFAISTDNDGNLTSWSIILQKLTNGSINNEIDILSAPAGSGFGTDLSRYCLTCNPAFIEPTMFQSASQGVWTRQDLDIPEPGTPWLFGAGLALLAGVWRGTRKMTH